MAPRQTTATSRVEWNRPSIEPAREDPESPIIEACGTAIASLTFSDPSSPGDKSSCVAVGKDISPSQSRGRKGRRTLGDVQEQDATYLSEADARREQPQVHAETDIDHDNDASTSTRSRRSSRFSSNHNSSTSPESSRTRHEFLGLDTEAAPERRPHFEEDDSELIVNLQLKFR